MNIIKDINRMFKTISLEDLDQIINQLYELIDNDGFVPDYVVYIERAGRLIGCKMAECFKCPVTGIKSLNSKEKIRDKFGKLFQILPKQITHYLKIIERNSFYHNSKKDIEFSFVQQADNLLGRVLLVDDAIDSGRSLQKAISFLNSKGIKRDSLKTAVITTSMSNPKVRADYSYFDNTVCYFPWAIDSQERQQYLMIYKSLESISEKSSNL